MVLQYIPCAHNDNKGEQITRNFLMSSLANSEGVLFGNYHLPVYSGTRECDLMLFNHWGVWIIEVKNWRGIIKIDQRRWQRNDGLIIHSPLISVEIKAKKLATVLENAGFINISVVGLVALAQTSAKLEHAGNEIGSEPHQDKIFHLGDRLIRAVTSRRYLNSANSETLDVALIQKIVDMLLPRYIDPEQTHIGDAYRIVYDLGPGPMEIFHAYQAEDRYIQGRYVRAKKYAPQNAISTADLQEEIFRFQRDMQALVKLEHHPNIIKVHGYQPDHDSDDMYWLLLEWVKGVTLQDRIDTGPYIIYQEQKQILSSILDALDCCHENGILHRNLTPSCIYLVNNGSIKLGDFDFARVPHLMKTLTTIGQPLPIEPKRYMAPELRYDASAADARSDLYSLGAIWYDMIVRPEPEDKIDLSLLEEAYLPNDACDLLIRLLQSNPEERPKNAKAVKRWLEQV